MIGLNETQLGIVAPFWFVDTVGPLMGPRATDRMLQLGQLLKPDQALQKGCVRLGTWLLRRAALRRARGH